MDQNKLWKILREIEIPDHLTSLLRNLYAVQEATVRTGYGTMNWFQVGKGVCQGCILSPYLFNFCTEYIMQNVRLDEAQTGSKVSRRNINNLRYADTTTVMAESKEELKSLLMRVKEDNGKSAFRTQDHGIWSHHFMANRWETMETVADFIFLDSKITVNGDFSHEIKSPLFLGRKAMANLHKHIKKQRYYFADKGL